MGVIGVGECVGGALPNLSAVNPLNLKLVTLLNS